MGIFDQLLTALSGVPDDTLARQIAVKILKDEGYSYKQMAEGLGSVGIKTSPATVMRDLDRFEGFLMYKVKYPEKIALYEKAKSEIKNTESSPTPELEEENTHTDIAMHDEIPPLQEGTDNNTTSFASPFSDTPVIDRTITKKVSAAFDEEELEEDDAILAGDDQIPDDVPAQKVAESFSYDAPQEGTIGGELPAAQVKFTSDSLLDLLTFYTPKALCFFTNINVRQVENETLVGNMPADAPDVVRKKNDLSKEAYQSVVTEYKPFLQKSILGVVSATKLNIKPEYMFIIHFIGFATQMQNVVREVNKSNSELLEQLRKEAKSEGVK